MSETGTLRYAPGEAWVDDVVIAIRGGQPDRYAAAKSYLVSRRYDEGDSITVEGNTDTRNEPPVVYMEDVHRADALTIAPARTAARGKTASQRAKIASRSETRKKTASAKAAPKRGPARNASSTEPRGPVTKARVPGSEARRRIRHR